MALHRLSYTHPIHPPPIRDFPHSPSPHPYRPPYTPIDPHSHPYSPPIHTQELSAPHTHTGPHAVRICGIYTHTHNTRVYTRPIRVWGSYIRVHAWCLCVHTRHAHTWYRCEHGWHTEVPTRVGPDSRVCLYVHTCVAAYTRVRTHVYTCVHTSVSIGAPLGGPRGPIRSYRCPYVYRAVGPHRIGVRLGVTVLL